MFYSRGTGGLWVEGAEHLFNLRQESEAMLRQTRLLSISPLKHSSELLQYADQ